MRGVEVRRTLTVGAGVFSFLPLPPQPLFRPFHGSEEVVWNAPVVAGSSKLDCSPYAQVTDDGQADGFSVDLTKAFDVPIA